MEQQLKHLQEAIEPYRSRIVAHPLYSVINNLEDLNKFMEHHVFAVWDFMSLLKSLQNNLTCTTVPWLPKGSANTRYLINEIVIGEESDVDAAGVRKSHFELYLDAMHQSRANTAPIEKFTGFLRQHQDLQSALKNAGVNPAATGFVENTFEVIDTNKPHVQAAVFTFGREDLIPDMFHAIITDLDQKFPDSISVFKYYLERHIEVDGDHHSHLAMDMTKELCGDNDAYWKEAEEATIRSLEKRISLWDGVYEAINSGRSR